MKLSGKEKKLSNTSLLAPRHIKREKASLPVDVRRSKTSLLNIKGVVYDGVRPHGVPMGAGTRVGENPGDEVEIRHAAGTVRVLLKTRLIFPRDFSSYTDGPTMSSGRVIE